jgi:bacteriocin biosynthesis cyclodehydratase domain-containing protein
MYAKGLQVIPLPDDRVLLKRGVHEIVVAGIGSREFLETLVSLLDGSRTRPEIIESFPADMQPVADRLLATLLRRGLASESPGEVPQQADGDGLVTAFFRNFLPVTRQTPGKLRDAVVVVAGVNLTTRSLTQSLIESGIGRVVLVHHPILDNFVSSGRWIDGLVAGAQGRIDERDDMPARAELGTASLLCATSDFGEAEALLQVNRLALETDRPFLPIWLAELIGYVGPLSYPHESACLRCYRLRADSNNGDWQLKRAVREFLTETPDRASSTGLAPPMPGVLGHVGAMEILKMLGEFAPADVIGRQIEINLVSFRSVVRRVLKVPRCPECGEGTRKSPRTLTLGPQIPQPVET